MNMLKKSLILITISSGLVWLVWHGIRFSVLSFKSYETRSGLIEYQTYSGPLQTYEIEKPTGYLQLKLNNSEFLFRVSRYLRNQARNVRTVFNTDVLNSCLKNQCELRIKTYEADLLPVIAPPTVPGIRYIYGITSSEGVILPEGNVVEELASNLAAARWLRIILPGSTFLIGLVFITLIGYLFRKFLKKSPA